MNTENAKRIEGWMADDELDFLASVAKKSKIIIEVGSYKGRSTRALGDNTNGIVYAIDPWNGPYYKNDNQTLFSMNDDIVYNEFLHNTKTCGNIVPFRGTFKQFLRGMPNTFKADFIFIDGDHRYEFVKEDILDSFSVISNHGVISGHDYTHADWPGVKKAVDEVLNGRKHLVNSIWWMSV